ncbi:TetR/AcrR family transcriptional regulator [Ureibacillus sp. FSL K6-8385]|uniref:TetR/AcrR family transcriptional regulator n=1 Tax=Ureibacillus terrenus TaxID=118246 RepID=A0A540V3V8_9BACL|nr:TetR/AcrR family transcriptional regulator [Ureibacillus terrenus]MED3763048.1 TetR/AcrR family transcriptional regulator [Ureibacillus terrenus]TQE91436.1 TetR/AcrR family transcriptional regulator [Ureibacillus terrenus]
MPRGRRVNSSGEKSKKLLLDIATELFSKYGYHKTKISDIVKAANLTQPTFYLYFENKESLYRDLILQFKNSFLENLDRLKEEAKGGNLIDLLHRHLTVLFQYFASNPYLTKIGFYQAEESEELKAKFSKVLEELLAERIEFSEHDPRIFAHSLVGAIERVTLMLLFTKEKEPEQLASEIINVYFPKTAVCKS